MSIGRFVFLSIVVASLAAAMAVWRGHLEVPRQWNPWAPLDLRDAPNLLTGHKLRRLQQDRELCLSVLETAEMRFTPMPDIAPEPRCLLENTVRIERSSAQFSAPFRATCHLAAAYALFERHGLQPAAHEVFGQSVARIDHFGSFACRTIARSNRLSQHATANAFDIAGFRLEDGTRITVARDWQGEGDAARFLRRVRDEACQVFNITLGPDYNQAHHDHFHVDMGGGRLCR
ncbi:extensin-like domain-containing protein [Stutzerimonas tarimensis]|uniref:Extensin family protein n=1 Tax=Stutzerimonas tarimensis TaxID=1507735 RepID=A0ABV7T012_9GAMM